MHWDGAVSLDVTSMGNLAYVPFKDPRRSGGRRARARPSGHAYKQVALREAAAAYHSSSAAATLLVGSTPMLTAPLRMS